jgi:hypothetical protein
MALEKAKVSGLYTRKPKVKDIKTLNNETGDIICSSRSGPDTTIQISP